MPPCRQSRAKSKWRCTVKVMKEFVVMWHASLSFSVCDHVDDSERKYAADHQCACRGAALRAVWVTVNTCVSASESRSMCLHVWESVRDCGPLPFIWASCDTRCCVTLCTCTSIYYLHMCVCTRSFCEHISDFVGTCVHTWTRKAICRSSTQGVLCIVCRLGLLLQWLETSLDHIKACLVLLATTCGVEERGMTQQGERVIKEKPRRGRKKQQQKRVTSSLFVAPLIKMSQRASQSCIRLKTKPALQVSKEKSLQHGSDGKKCKNPERDYRGRNPFQTW